MTWLDFCGGTKERTKDALHSPSKMSNTREEEIFLSQHLVTENLVETKNVGHGALIRERVLELPFKNIKSLENLCGYGFITKLVLHNNRVEEIRGLDNLTQLKHLDLSFNLITKIKGIQSLLCLQTLSLFVSKLLNYTCGI